MASPWVGPALDVSEPREPCFGPGLLRLQMSPAQATKVSNAAVLACLGNAEARAPLNDGCGLSALRDVVVNAREFSVPYESRLAVMLCTSRAIEHVDNVSDVAHDVDTCRYIGVVP
jgi:hypothetical protein